jgi:hypothetical protein
MAYSEVDEKLLLNFSLKNCQKNIHYKIELFIEELSNVEYQSEEIKCNQNGLEIIFSKKMPCNFYFSKRQKVKINVIKKIPIDSNYKKKISERVTLLSSLIASPDSIYERKINDKNPNSEVISIKIEKDISNSEDNKTSLFDFFKCGLKLSCYISLDYSNEINNPLKNTTINYLNILKNISGTISNYTKNHLFYAFGFGARPIKNFSNQNVFNLNMDEKDSSINTLDKVIQNFNSCLSNNLISPEENRNFSSLIKKITNEIYFLYELRYYNVSFILTRGNLEKNDIQKTIDAVIESSYLPLTIFVIGIGKNDFSQIQKFIGSNHKFSSLGMEKMRNNVLFASLIDDFSNSDEKLISWCIKELSKQITSFYELNKTSPEDIYQNKLKGIRKSFHIYNSSVGVEKSVLSDSQNKKGSLNDLNDKMENMNLDALNTDYIYNPYIKDINKNKDIKNNETENKGTGSFEELSDKKFIIKKPQMYESVLDKNNPKGNTNSISNNNSEDNKAKTTDEPATTVDNNFYVQKPTDSIREPIKENPKKKLNNNEEKDTEAPAPIIIDNKKYCIGTESICDSNQNLNYNPYAEDLKRKKNEKNNEKINIQKNNYSMEQKIMNNISEASEFNSTNTSENIKCSNFFLFGDCSK